MSYVLHPAAEAEHVDSVAFYESRGPGLGAEYSVAFENVMRRMDLVSADDRARP